MVKMQMEGEETGEEKREKNKAGYTATPVTCRWAGAVFEVT